MQIEEMWIHAPSYGTHGFTRSDCEQSFGHVLFGQSLIKFSAIGLLLATSRNTGFHTRIGSCLVLVEKHLGQSTNWHVAFGVQFTNYCKHTNDKSHLINHNIRAALLLITSNRRKSIRSAFCLRRTQNTISNCIKMAQVAEIRRKRTIERTMAVAVHVAIHVLFIDGITLLYFRTLLTNFNFIIK